MTTATKARAQPSGKTPIDQTGNARVGRQGIAHNRFRRPPIDRVSVAIALTVAAALMAAGLVRAHNGWPGAFDLGLFDQAVWLLAHGHAHVSIIGRNVFTDHLAPVLFAFAALYRLHPSVAWLLGAQALAVGATVAPMRRLAALEGVPPWIATLATVANASLLSAAFFDFHTSTLAAPAVAWMLLGARRDDRRLTAVAAVAVLLCRADLVSVVLAVAIVARPRARRVAALVGVAGVVCLALSGVVGASGVWALHYGSLAKSPVDLALHPWKLIVGLIRPGTAMSLLWWLAPVGFLPLRRPRWLAAVLVAGLPMLLIQWTTAHLPYFQYGAPLAPLALGGAFVVLAGLRNPFRQRSLRNLCACVALSAATISPLTPLPLPGVSVWTLLSPGHGHDVRLPLADIRPDEVVSAAERLVPRLSHRREIYDFPAPFMAGGTHGNSAPSSLAAARVQVVVVTAADAHFLRQLGFTRVVYADRNFVMARRPST
jgi:uncharacterized membrane protein